VLRLSVVLLCSTFAGSVSLVSHVPSAIGRVILPHPGVLLVVVLLDRFLRCGRGRRRQIVGSTVITGVATADVRSSFQVRHEELMAASLMAIP
jgi:hypothetical protein